MEGCQVFIIQEKSVAGALLQYLNELFFNLPKREIAVINPSNTRQAIYAGRQTH